MKTRFERMWTVGNYEIQEFCLESFPCQHSIKDLRTGKIWLYRADDIFVMLRKDGVSHPHFEYCREIIRKRENPTPKEIAEAQAAKVELERQIVEQEQKQKEKQKEIDDLINKTKASSRLERLKTKNNIQ